MNTANPYAPPRANVADAAEEHVELEPASRGLRLGAALLDGVIANVFVYVPTFIGMLISPPSGRPGDLPVLSTVLMLLGLVAWLALTIVYVARNGQTIAKKLLNIRVVRTDGSKASLGRIFWLRNFVPGLLNFTIIFWIIDPLFIFGDERQCLHDKIADTSVVAC
jgi:uncharacterized RDD family membrane protein YckC